MISLSWFQIDENVQREIINHRSLRHPNIIRFKEVIISLLTDYILLLAIWLEFLVSEIIELVLLRLLEEYVKFETECSDALVPTLRGFFFLNSH